MLQQAPPTLPPGVPTASYWRADARVTLRLAAQIALGTIPLGVASGLLVLHGRLPWWWATVFSSVVFAWSLEFLLVAMAATGVALARVALTTRDGRRRLSLAGPHSSSGPIRRRRRRA